MITLMVKFNSKFLQCFQNVYERESKKLQGQISVNMIWVVLSRKASFNFIKAKMFYYEIILSDQLMVKFNSKSFSYCFVDNCEITNLQNGHKISQLTKVFHSFVCSPKWYYPNNDELKIFFFSEKIELERTLGSLA